MACFMKIIMHGYYCLTFKWCFFIVEKETLGAILCKEIVCQLQLQGGGGIIFGLIYSYS